VTFLRVTRDLSTGERIKPTDLEMVTIPQEVSGGLGNVLTRADWDFAIKQAVNQPVNKNQWLLWSFVTQGDSALYPSAQVPTGMVAFPLQVDPRMAPGEILRVGDRVNLIGTFTIGDKYANYTILEGVRVREVGGRIPRDRTAGSSVRTTADDGMSSFRSITIEISPEVAKKLANLITHAGAITVTVRNPTEEFPASPPGPQINREVAPLADTAYGGPPPGAPTP
jgi:Flp pilus assembly protein CpaB